MSPSCLDCTQRSDRVFCDLELDALKAFDGIKSTQTCPKGTVLFREGQVARGVFLLCKGRVRLSVCRTRPARNWPSCCWNGVRKTVNRSSRNRGSNWLLRMRRSRR